MFLINISFVCFKHSNFKLEILYLRYVFFCFFFVVKNYGKKRMVVNNITTVKVEVATRTGLRTSHCLFSEIINLHRPEPGFDYSDESKTCEHRRAE